MPIIPGLPPGLVPPGPPPGSPPRFDEDFEVQDDDDHDESSDDDEDDDDLSSSDSIDDERDAALEMAFDPDKDDTHPELKEGNGCSFCCSYVWSLEFVDSVNLY